MSGINIPIKVSDGVSATFQNMASNVEKTFNSLQRLKGVMSSDFSKPISSIGNNTLKNKQYQDMHNQSISEGATKANGLLGKIKGIAGAYLGIQGLKKAIDIGDSVANMNASIGMISNGTKDTEANLKKIYDMSIRTRSSFTDNAKIVGKLGLLAKDAFKDNNELIAFSETMNKAFKVSGASIIEQTAAMHQLTQAMASGRLQGDEFRSILENAPMLAQAIQKELNGIDMKKASSEGMITSDVIKRAMFNAADEINKRFAGLPVTFGNIMNVVKNVGIKTLTPLWEAFSRLWNNDKVQKFAVGIAYTFGILGQIGASAIDGINVAIGFLVDNMNIILPIVGTLVGAFLIYKGVLLATAVIKGVLAVAEAIHAAGVIAATIATGSMTMAQWGLNTALYACPITWIILGVIAFIVVLVMAIKYVGGLAGEHVSAIGIMVGLWYGFAAVVSNILTFFRLVGKLIAYSWQLTIQDIKSRILSMKLSFLQAVREMAVKANTAGNKIGHAFVMGINIAIKAVNWLIKAINHIPGMNISQIDLVKYSSSGLIDVGGIDNSIAKTKSELDKAKSPTLDLSDIKFKNLGEAFSEGYNKGSNFVKGVKDKFKEVKDGINEVKDLMNGKGGFENGYKGGVGGLGDAGKALKDTAKNTKKIADNTDKTNLDVKFLREMAERQAINRYTTTNITINNSVSDINTEDLDGFVDHLNNQLQEKMNVQADGYYNTV